jgi:2-dehydro-3-deoxyphosphogluconate aldolase/(4S)-4-hydroxy-2-oxoglutarate aldolase
MRLVRRLGRGIRCATMTLLERFDPQPHSARPPAAPVVPVIVLDDARHAVPLARACVAGGIAVLEALAGPFPALRFCPTGGVDARSAPQYLALPNVAAVRGSWLTPTSAIAREDLAAGTTLARAAAALRTVGRVS